MTSEMSSSSCPTVWEFQLWLTLSVIGCARERRQQPDWGRFFSKTNRPLTTILHILRSEAPGEPLWFKMTTKDKSGNLIADAELDVWQAHAKGRYDDRKMPAATCEDG